MPAETPQGVPESVVFGQFDGYKNTVQRERLGPADLYKAINIDLDDAKQAHRRRGQTLVDPTPCHSLWNANDGTVYGVRAGDLGIINPDYSFVALVMGINGGYDQGISPISYIQILDDIYYSWEFGSGIISHSTGMRRDWGPDQDIWISPVVNPTKNLPQVAGRVLGKPPYATALAYYNGRIYLAEDNVLWGTTPFAYGFVDKTRGFVQFEGKITMLGQVSDGLYVGTTEGVWFLSGASFEKMHRTRVMDSPAIRGSMVYIPAELANPPQIGPGVDTPTELSIGFMSTRGFCVAADSGKCTNLTESKVFFPVAQRAASFWRRQDGMNQYITVLDAGGEPVNGARIGDFVDAEIRRGGASWAHVVERVHVRETAS